MASHYLAWSSPWSPWSLRPPRRRLRLLEHGDDYEVADSLSPREREVLHLLAGGLSNAEIARQLFLSKGTARTYVSGILAKLGVADRTQAAVIALRHGLMD